MKQLRGGNLGSIVNFQVMGGSNQCIRAILIRDKIGQPKVTDMRSRFTFGIGELSERLEVDRLLSEGRMLSPNTELKEELPNGVVFTGHADIIEKVEKRFYPDLMQSLIVWELKSISSVKVSEKIFKKCEPKYENVIQLVGYMIVTETSTGILRYTSTIYTENKIKAGDYKDFIITVDQDGNISSNGIRLMVTPSIQLNILHIELFKREASNAIKNDEIYPIKPKNWESIFSPCNGCWLQKTCESYEDHKNGYEFFEDAEKEIQKLGKRV
jgi:hypothetical protein